MSHFLIPQVDFEVANKSDLYNQCFDIFRKDIIQTSFSNELETRILDVLESIQSVYSNCDDITEIVCNLPNDTNTVEHLIVSSMYEFAEAAFNQWDQTQQARIIQQTVDKVTITIDPDQEVQEDAYERISVQEATDILYSRVYKKVSRQRHNISNIELKVLFIQFYFANSQDRSAILSELTDPQEKHDFIIAAWDVIKKFLNINPSLTLSEVQSLYQVTGAVEFKKKGGGGSDHTLYELQVPSLEDPTALHSFKLALIADSSAKKNKIYLASVFQDFAQRVTFLQEIAAKVDQDHLDSVYPKSKEKPYITNVKDLNRIIIAFLEHVMIEYKFNKFKK